MRFKHAIAALLLGLLGLGPGGVPGATAQTPVPSQAPAPAPTPESSGGSFVTPFPENDTYRIQVYGDSLAEGMLGGLIEALTGEPRITLQRRHRKLAAVFGKESEDETPAIEAELGREPPHIAVVMLNPTSGFPWRQPYDRRKFPPGTEAWKDEFDRRRDEWKVLYGARLDRINRAFRRRNIAVYWVGLPILRRQESTDDAQIINELVRERATFNGMKYVDVLASFADEGGAYNAYGPDLAGKSRQLRETDGVHFTQPGYRKLAHFIERELKRDITQARSDRNIPLAGAETEQRRIRPIKPATPATPVAAGPGARPGTAPGLPGLKSDRPGAPSRPAAPAVEGAAGDIKADNARITLKAATAPGRDDAVTLDILRPAIPANVVQLVTRRESVEKASQVGDSILTEIAGGLMVVSSVTAATETAGGDARRATPTNSPYYRALVKGERIEPRSGRADDFPWPRPEALPQPKPVPAAAPASPASKGGPTPPVPAKSPPPAKKAPSKG